MQPSTHKQRSRRTTAVAAYRPRCCWRDAPPDTWQRSEGLGASRLPCLWASQLLSQGTSTLSASTSSIPSPRRRHSTRQNSLPPLIRTYVQHACVQRKNAVLGRGGEERRCHPAAIGREKSPRDGRSCRARPSVGLRTPGTSAGWSSPYCTLRTSYARHVLPTGLQSPLIQPLDAASAEGRDHISPTSSQTGPTSPNFRWCQHSTRCSSQAVFRKATALLNQTFGFQRTTAPPARRPSTTVDWR
jgi:hypothetical protein